MVNQYRTSSPQANQMQKDSFITQKALIYNVITNKTILLGDFKLDQKNTF